VLVAVLAAMLAAACGSTATVARPPQHPVSVAVVGRLAGVHGSSLTVRDSASAGTMRVTFAPRATPIYSVSIATTGDIQPGSCVAAQGDRDATGNLTARVIVVASSADDACPAASVPSPPSPAVATPCPGSFPLPSPSPAPPVLQGQVLSLGGNAIAVQGPQGDPVVVMLAHGVRILFFAPADRSALVIPSCVVVQGTRSGRTVTARQIVDWPPHTGC